MFLSYIAAALLLWGSSYTGIQLRVEHTFAAAISSGPLSDGTCRIFVDEERMLNYSPAQQQSIITHEVGHCLGLDHYGDCNSNQSIMGCAVLERVTEYDKMMLAKTQGLTFSAYLPMVGN